MGLIAFSGGARMVVESDLPDGGLNDRAASFRGVQVYGTDGVLEIGESLRLLNARSGGWKTLEVPGDTNQYEEMIAWIEGRREHRNAAPIARATVELMMAIYESVRVKGRVTLPLKTKDNPLRQMIEDGTLPVERPGRVRHPSWLGLSVESLSRHRRRQRRKRTPPTAPPIRRGFATGCRGVAFLQPPAPCRVERRLRPSFRRARLLKGPPSSSWLSQPVGTSFDLPHLRLKEERETGLRRTTR
ncbi:MAG: hypothetical protein KatS3mg115_2313 [Candidatus Poribacteria bacterium]|nr:MAG: hypothetical protein KatS3mg115_2313 [Candidatus Poribacteria bacterium]